MLEGVDHEQWREFAEKCIQEKIKVGEKINELVRKELDK